MDAWVIVGMAIGGRFKGEWVIVSNLFTNSLAMTKEKAEDNLRKAKNNISPYEIDIHSVQFAKVTWDVSMSEYNKVYDL